MISGFWFMIHNVRSQNVEGCHSIEPRHYQGPKNHYRARESKSRPFALQAFSIKHWWFSHTFLCKHIKSIQIGDLHQNILFHSFACSFCGFDDLRMGSQMCLPSFILNFRILTFLTELDMTLHPPPAMHSVKESDSNYCNLCVQIVSKWHVSCFNEFIFHDNSYTILADVDGIQEYPLSMHIY